MKSGGKRGKGGGKGGKGAGAMVAVAAEASARPPRPAAKRDGGPSQPPASTAIRGSSPPPLACAGGQGVSALRSQAPTTTFVHTLRNDTGGFSD